MALPVCKLFHSNIVCGVESEYSIIRSTCGTNYEFLFNEEDKKEKIICCHNVGVVARCSAGHQMFYHTEEIRMFANTRPYVRCKLCGDYIFLHNEKLVCINMDYCKH